MFSQHPWKVIVGWISAVSTDKNSCGWWSLCRSSPTAVWIQATWMESCRSSASADSTSSNPRLFRCTQPIWERQTVGRRLGGGGEVGCRRHRSELRHQVKRQWRWHLRYTGWRGAVPRLILVARRISVESVRIDGRFKLVTILKKIIPMKRVWHTHSSSSLGFNSWAWPERIKMCLVTRNRHDHVSLVSHGGLVTFNHATDNHTTFNHRHLIT